MRCHMTCAGRDSRLLLELMGEDSHLYGKHSDGLGGFLEAANAGLPWDLTSGHGRWKIGSKVPKMYHSQSLKYRKTVTQNLGL